MADNNTGPDWGLIGGAAAAVMTALATAIAGARGAFRDQRADREKTADRESDLLAGRDKSTLDHTAQTIDVAFRLINELQDEVTRRAIQLVDTEMRCAARIEALEVRIASLERELREGKAPG